MECPLLGPLALQLGGVMCLFHLLETDVELGLEMKLQDYSRLSWKLQSQIAELGPHQRTAMDISLF